MDRRRTAGRAFFIGLFRPSNFGEHLHHDGIQIEPAQDHFALLGCVGGRFLVLLHDEWPSPFPEWLGSTRGIDFIAERPSNGRGFVVKIDWVSTARSKAETSFASGEGWAHQVDIALDDDSLYNSGGGGSVEHYSSASAYDQEKRALAKALAAPAARPISVILATRLRRK